jgi:hypothetical protein
MAEDADEGCFDWWTYRPRRLDRAKLLNYTADLLFEHAQQTEETDPSMTEYLREQGWSYRREAYKALDGVAA